MTTIITIASSKGGTGKTTTSISLAAGLANFEPALLVDLDDQGHCSLGFGLPVRSGLYDWIAEGLPLSDCLLTGRPPSLRILPGDSRSKMVQRLIETDVDFINFVGRLHHIAGYEFVVIDTNPSGGLTEAALAAADIVIVPFRPEAFAIDGLFTSLQLTMELAPAATVLALPVAFDVRLREHRDNMERVRSHMNGSGDIMQQSAIRHRVAVMEAQASGQTIWEYGGPKGPQGIRDVRSDYSQLVSHVLVLAGRQVAEEQIEEGLGT